MTTATATARTTDDARDVREGGEWSRAQRLKNDVLYVLVTALLAIVARLPESSVVRFGRFVGRAAHALLPDARRTARANLAAAFPGEDDARLAARAKDCFLRLGEYLGDAALQLSGRRAIGRIPIEETSLAVLEEARSAGRGVLLLSAHLGPWERVAEALAAATPFVAIGRSAYDPRLTRLLEGMRASMGVVCISRDGRFAGLKLLRALKRGVVVGVPIDLKTRAASLVVPWFERPAAVPRGAIDLALRAGSPIVVATVAPSNGAPDRLVVTVERLVVDHPAEAGTEEIRLLEAAARALCARIRAFPEGWPFMHPRFHEPTR